MDRIKDKVAIITGGGSGIGRATSLLFANEGAKVCILDNDTNGGKETINLIREKKGEAFFIKTNMVNIKDINHAVEEVVKRYNKIDILINNVGMPIVYDFNNINENTFQKDIDINFKAAVFCTKVVLTNMINKSNGSIVFLSSINAILGGFGAVLYSSIKGAIHSFAINLAAEYSKNNIRFNVVCPSSTPIGSKLWGETLKTNPKMLDIIKEIHPLGRYGNPNDIAYAILYLASDEASWVTGVVLPVDGGIRSSVRFPGRGII